MTHRADGHQHPVIQHSKPFLMAEDRSAMDAVLKSGLIAEGTLAEKFEQAISRYSGLKGGVATSSGTSALFLALKVLEIDAGDEVIIPTYTCRSVWDAVRAAGAVPILADAGDDWCINVGTIRPLISTRTKAIIVVHTFGVMADVEPLCALGIPVIEDCCQAFGSRREEKLAGTLGRLSVLSFHATKLLTTGEGGMVLTDDGPLLERLRALKRGEGEPLAVRYRHPMTDLQAALGLSQLAKYDDFLRRRRSIADYYLKRLTDLSIELPEAIKDHSIFFRFPVRIKGDFDTFRERFETKGIQVRRGVDALLHRQCGLNPEDFPGAEQCFAKTLSIPLYPALSDEDRDRIVEVCRTIFGTE